MRAKKKHFGRGALWSEGNAEPAEQFWETRQSSGSSEPAQGDSCCASALVVPRRFSKLVGTGTALSLPDAGQGTVFLDCPKTIHFKGVLSFFFLCLIAWVDFH